MPDARGIGVASFLAHAFAPREVFFTWAGRFRFIRVTAGAQKIAVGGAIAAAILLIAWGSVATIGNVLDKTDLAAKRLEIARQIQANAALDRRLRAALDRGAALDARIAVLNEGLSEEQAGRLALRDQRDSMAQRIGHLEQRLVDLQESEQEVVERLSEQAREESHIVEKTIAMTGLDAAKLIAGITEADSDSGSEIGPGFGPGDRDSDLADPDPAGLDLAALGQGGPYIPAGPDLGEGLDSGEGPRAGDGAEPGSKLAVLIARLEARLTRWSALRQAVRHLPLAVPLDQYRISSAYGHRRDPVTKRQARHLGVDFVAPFGTPVRATAPGLVVYAGRHGRYGRMIEIDHGHGLRTRYAHLRKVLVKDGQQIGHRQEIGLLGSSGRSTGPHLHYEIRFEGQAQNPMKYILAGQHLLKD